MDALHLAYLNLGSNIQPEANLPKAIKLLSELGEITRVSQVWESKAVGTRGPNYFNACVLFISARSLMELKDQVALPIEAQLGRQRTQDKFAPRPMDIDIILFDDQPINIAVWDLAFVVVPLADIYPHYHVAAMGETVLEIATRLRQTIWLEMRAGVL